MNTSVIRIALFFSLILAGAILALQPGWAQDRPQEDWRAEFDDICSKTNDAMSLPKDELKALVERCDRLKPRIEKLDESAAKVYLKRLKMCRDLFVFVQESASH